MPLRHSRQIVSAWPYYRASCEIDGIIAGASAMESVLSQGDESSPRVDVPTRSRR